MQLSVCLSVGACSHWSAAQWQLRGELYSHLKSTNVAMQNNNCARVGLVLYIDWTLVKWKWSLYAVPSDSHPMAPREECV